jgi:pyruvate/2-oxoglutarate dehydrogenase complex dihydrolipoamide dehydrogenase (E3) component
VAVGGDADESGVWPLDAHNALLLDRVAPKHWLNPRGATEEEELYYDLVAIGAGAGGLVSSKQSARRGARSALIEKHMAGGDCLNVGCVPSKALIRCARAAAAVRDAAAFGIVPTSSGAPTHAVDFAKVMERMREIRARIAPADSLETSARVGAACFSGRATFTGPRTLRVDLGGGEAGGVRNIRFGAAVVATGARAFVPPIAGLAAAPFHTNATLFNLTALPPRLVIIGAGPIGVEMAQAFALLGARVTCVVRSSELLPREDRDAAAVVRAALERDGVTIVTGYGYERVDVVANDAAWSAAAPCVDARWPLLALHGTVNGAGAAALECECLLVATGRAPNVEGLGLDAAGVEYDAKVSLFLYRYISCESFSQFDSLPLTYFLTI